MTEKSENSVQAENLSFRRSRRAKYLRITIRPDSSVTVTVPQRATMEQARKFAASKQDWISKKLHQLNQRRTSAKQLDPANIDLEQAQEELFNRLLHFSRLYELPVRKVTFRCQKTRWASCSGKNNLSLNINICCLPVHLQDYILLHELCHVRHKNHSPAFWAMLDELTEGKAKQLRNELKAYAPARLRL